jgi:cytosine/uracil/thiamine/allantoin permease
MPNVSDLQRDADSLQTIELPLTMGVVKVVGGVIAASMIDLFIKLRSEPVHVIIHLLYWDAAT